MSGSEATILDTSDIAPFPLPPLPEGWCWASAKQVGEVVTGSTPSKQTPEFFGGTVPFFKPTDLNAGYCVRTSSDSLTALGAAEARLLPARTVLVTCIGATIGKTGLGRTPCATNQQINALVCPADTSLPEWCYWVFLSSWGQEQISRNASATTLPILNKGKFERLLLPIAPLQEQRRIVAKLDELFSDLDAGVAALKRAKANLKRYRAAVLKAAVEGRLTEQWRAAHPATEPAAQLLERILAERRQKWEAEQLAKYAATGKTPPKDWQSKYVEPTPLDTTGLPELPHGWCWATADHLLIAPTCNGISVKGSPKPPGIPALRLSAMSDNGFDYDERRFIPISEEVASELRIQAGDFFTARGNGSLHLVGRGTLAQEPPETIVFPDTMIRLRFTTCSPVARLLNRLWPSRFFRKQIEKKARTTAGIYKISQRDVERFVVPLPPAKEQEQLVAEVEERLSVIDVAETQIVTNLQRGARLRQSILKRAFEGKLVPQDANDEPASVLLDRIRAARKTAPQRRNAPGNPRRRQVSSKNASASPRKEDQQ